MKLWSSLRSCLTDPLSFRRCLILLVCGLMLAYTAGLLGFVLVVPELGIRCAFTPVINYAFPDFVVPDQTPLLEGDHITALAGRPLHSWSELLRQIEAARLRPADDCFLREVEGQRLVRVDFLRDGTPLHTWLQFGPTPLDALLPSFCWLVLRLGLLVVAAIVWWKRPLDTPACAFYWLCVVSFGAFLGGYHWSRIVTQPLLLLVFMFSAVLVPAVTLHFYLVFPRIKSFLVARPWLFLGVYGPPVVFLCLLLWGYLRVRVSDDADHVLREMLLAVYVYLILAATWYLASIAALLHSFLTAETPVERNQVKWILSGSALATLPIGYSLYLAVFDAGRFGAGGAAWPMCAASAFVTIAYAVSITRYGLMRIDQLLTSGASYFLLTSLAAGLYYAFLFLFFLVVGIRFFEGPSLIQVLSAAATAMLLMMLMDLGRARLQRVLNRLYHREKNQLDLTLSRMSQVVDRLVDPPTLARQLLATAAELLGSPAGSVYLRQQQPGVFLLAASLGPSPQLNELSFSSPVVSGLGRSPLVRSTAPPAVQRQLSTLGAELAYGLFHEGQLLGLVLLAPRNGQPYSSDELHRLTAFAQLTALALSSAEGHRTIEALNQELKTKIDKIAEQQRRILSLQSQLTQKHEPTVLAENTPPPGAAPIDPPPSDGPIGSSIRMQALLGLARRVAASNSAVLLRGESGTGKEVLARVLHESSPRANKPFIKVHCAALSPGLLESELFGHVKGAFTNAIRDKVGRFEAADGGTLFLDEIGDISLDVQTKLLRFLEEMTFERVGSSEPVQVDVRLIAATHRDLEAMIRDGRFREDLFFRLNVISITLPPLRERREDIPELVAHFLAMYSARIGKRGLTIDDDALAALKGHIWRGNIRELENVIERAVVIAEGSVITRSDLPPELQRSAAGAADVLDDTTPLDLHSLANLVNQRRAERDRREREALVRALAAANGNKSEAARALGWARSTFISRLKKFGLT
ncbi:MAG: sigma 54-interacting transcriptional regulator [Gemmataceae bacterium]